MTGFCDKNVLHSPAQNTRPNKKKKKKEMRYSGPQSENHCKRKRERQVIEPWKRTKEAVGRKSDGETNCNLSTWNGPKAVYNDEGGITIIVDNKKRTLTLFFS